MATFVVCTCCGTTQEIAAIDQLPRLWRQTPAGLRCPRCAIKDDASADDLASDILEEEVIYPHPGEDNTLDDFENECTVCRGPCRGH